MLFKRLVSVTLAALFGAGGIVSAEQRIATLDELNGLAVAASASRRADRGTLERFFSNEAAQRALKQARVDAKQVFEAVATLSDEDAARLAARAGSAERDFAAGALSTQELTYIVIALATAVLILVIVAAR